MANALPQFYPNDLSPFEINEETLWACVKEFRSAIANGVRYLEAEYPVPNAAEATQYGNIFTGQLGIPPVIYLSSLFRLFSS
jgi:hypothetical protein